MVFFIYFGLNTSWTVVIAPEKKLYRYAKNSPKSINHHLFFILVSLTFFITSHQLETAGISRHLRWRLPSAANLSF